MWTLVRDGSTNKYGLSSVHATIQGSGGPSAFDDTISTWIVATQEGQTGTAFLPIGGTIPNPYLGGYASNESIYNNPRAISQKSGYTLVTCSTGANTALLMQTSSSLGLWQLTQLTQSHCCATDGTWSFIVNDGSHYDANGNATGPGTLQIVNNAQGPTGPSGVITLTAHNNDSWALDANGNGGAYWIYLDTANNRLAIGANQSNNLAAATVYLYDYSPLYGGTPSAPTFLATVSENYGFPLGNRLFCVTGFTLHTYSLATPSSPSLIGGSSTYTTTHSGETNWGLIQYDTVNNIIYLPWGTKSTICGFDVVARNTGTDALTTGTGFNTHQFPDGSYMQPTFATLASDGTKLAYAEEYPQHGGATAAGGAFLLDVHTVHSGGSPTELSFFPCQAEPRGVFMAENDTAAYVYTFSRYMTQVLDANDKLVGVSVANGVNLVPTQPRAIGVTSGNDPDGLTGPCTSANYCLVVSGGDGPNVDQVWHCYNGSMAEVYQQSATFFDAYWDGKYLWASLNNIGHNGTPCIGRYTVTWTSGGGWVFTLHEIWVGAHFCAGGNSSIMLVPGTSFDAGTAMLLISFSYDPTVMGSVQAYAGVHLVNWGNGSSITEVTTGIFGTGQYGGDPILEPIADINTTATLTVTSGGSLDSPYTYWFQLAYYDANGLLLAVTNPPVGGQAGVSVGSSGFSIVITSLPTPPPRASQILVGGAYTFGTGQTYNQATNSLVQIAFVNANVTSITVSTQKENWTGPMPLPGNPLVTAGNLGRAAADPNTGNVYIPCGDTNGIRCYGNLTSATPILVGALTKNGLPIHYDQIPMVSNVVVFSMGGKTWLGSNNYGALAGDVGNGALVWDITNGFPSGAGVIPTWLGSGSDPTHTSPGPNEGFTAGYSTKNNLFWLGGLCGIQGWRYA